MPTVTFIPRDVAERTPPLPGTLLISITHPGDLADVDDWSPNLLCLYFDDIETPISGHAMFDVEMAARLIGHVDSCREQDIIVHCEAGMSRSAAVAKWLSERREFKLCMHPKGIGTVQHYNRHVYRTLDAADGRDQAAYYAELERMDRAMEGWG